MTLPKIERPNEHELAQWVFYHIEGCEDLVPCFQRYGVDEFISAEEVFDRIKDTLIKGKIPIEGMEKILTEQDIIIDQILFTNNSREDEIITKVLRYWRKCTNNSSRT